MLLAIDIGTKYIHIVEGKYKNKKLHIQKKAKILTPVGCIEDGEIVDFTRLKVALKDLLRDHHIKARKVSLTIETSQLIERKLELPKVKDKEIYTLLEGQIMGMIGEEIAYVTTYEALESDDKNHLKVHFYGLPENIIAKYKKLLEELKLHPVALMMHQNAMESFVNIQLQSQSKPFIVADIGNHYLNLHLMDEGKRKFTQTIQINTDQCERTLLSVRRIHEENKDFYNLEVSQAQLEEDIILDTTMRPYLTQLIQQIISMMQYQLTISQSRPVEAIYLCGGVSQLKGIDTYIGENVGVPVTQIGEDALYCNAIGAISSEFDFLKRYKQVVRHNKTLSKQTTRRLVTLAVLAGGVGIAYMSVGLLKSNVDAQSRQIIKFLESEEIQVQLEIAKEKEALLNATKRYTKGLEEAGNAIESMPSMTQEVMADVASCMPQEVTVSALAYQKGEMMLMCTATTKNAIHQMVNQLRQLNSVHDVGYSGYVQKDAVYVFEIRIVFAEGGMSS